MRQFNANNWLTVAEIFPKLQSVELSPVSSTGGETALVLYVDVGLAAAVSLVDGLGGVEEVARQERHHSVTALRPDGKPGGEAGPLPLLAVRQHRALLGEVEKFAQLVDLGRGQPQLGLVELLQQVGGLTPLEGRHLLVVLHAGRETVQLDAVEDRVKPSVSFLLQVSRCQPVRPLLQRPEVRHDAQVLVD